MYVGDFLELIAMGCIIAAVFLILMVLVSITVGVGGGLLVLGAALLYLAEQYSDRPIPRPRLHIRKRG